MKLSYWYAQCTDDHDCYSVIAKTKKGVQEKIKELGRQPEDYAKPVRKEITYADAFDLLDQATCEGGGRGCGMTMSKET